MTADEIAAAFKETLRTNLSILEKIEDNLISERNHAFRWSYASLLTVNSGALVATLSTSQTLGKFAVYAGLAFLGGLIAAIFIAILVQTGTSKTISSISLTIGKLRQSITSLQEPEKVMKSAEKILEDPIPKPANNHLHAMWISILLFIIGTSITGYAVYNSSQHNTSELTLNPLDIKSALSASVSSSSSQKPAQ